MSFLYATVHIICSSQHLPKSFNPSVARVPDLTTSSAAYQDVKVYHKMSRTKNKAVSEGNGPIPQDKSGFEDSRWWKYIDY